MALAASEPESGRLRERVGGEGEGGTSPSTSSEEAALEGKPAGTAASKARLLGTADARQESERQRAGQSLRQPQLERRQPRHQQPRTRSSFWRHEGLKAGRSG